ncbi:hypothetical protein AWB81_04435 [Caballeronia arationis]|jgi:hypothetical protein|uniref:hypothetical protein n=1 Tax=Caballeronia arationis TaxID=1777142 RepID=UPI00074BBEFB|nr:hypothetical protein [Caballeronia arationis]SAK86361.1 hypothetical protein AWB81_04435 [Caballeronia arationis]
MPYNQARLPAIVDYDEWLRGTSSLLQPRSAALKALDQQILTYHRDRSTYQFHQLKNAFRNWKESVGPSGAWESDARNESKLFSLLDQQLGGKGDTDAAMGAQDFMTPALVNSRLGVLYLFGNVTIEDDVFQVMLEGAFEVTIGGLGIADSNDAASRASDVLENSVVQKSASLALEQVQNRIRKHKGNKLVNANQLTTGSSPPPTGSAARALYDSIRAKLDEAAMKLWNMIREKVVDIRDDPGAFALDVMPGLIRKLVDFLCKKLLVAVAPLIGASLDIAKGIANTVDSSITKYREWVAGREVQLLAGHPSTIIEAIRRAMKMSIGAGVYDMVKGGADLGLQIASQGASTIVGAVVSILETLAKSIWKIVEIKRMQRFFQQAKVHWEARMHRDALHTQPIAFNNWFKRYAIPLPVLSVLALNSGICGDKMHFLAMFKDDDAVIGEAEFQAGCKYVDDLKVWGSTYLSDAGFSFASEDNMVKSLLEFSGNHKQEQTWDLKVRQAVLGFLNG